MLISLAQPVVAAARRSRNRLLSLIDTAVVILVSPRHNPAFGSSAFGHFAGPFPCSDEIPEGPFPFSEV